MAEKTDDELTKVEKRDQQEEEKYTMYQRTYIGQPSEEEESNNRTITEIRSIFHLIKAYYWEKRKCFRKRIIPLIFECILEIKKDHAFDFLLVLINTKNYQ